MFSPRYSRNSRGSRPAAILAASALVGAVSLAVSGAAFAACTGPGAPTTTQTRCLTAMQIPGNPLISYDISWTNPDRAEYYLGDRSNKGVDVFDTDSLTFKRTIGGFVGFTGSNDTSGPDGVVSHGRWLYAGDGDSSLKVIDLDAATPIQQTLFTGGIHRVDEMALNSDGTLLLVANNADDPPFGTLFRANGDNGSSNVHVIARIDVSPSILPPNIGLSIEQPTWDPKTERFYTSIPIIANNPPKCNADGSKGPISCHGGLLVIDPANPPTGPVGAFDPATHTGVVKLDACGPNGATVGPHDNLLLGCTTANNPSDTSTLVINAAINGNSVNVANIVGSDEVWFNRGDHRYYTASNRRPGGAVLGVIGGQSNVLIEAIPQSSGSHSVAADSKRNLIFVPESAQSVDTTVPSVGAGICGGANGCIGVYIHRGDGDRDGDDH